MRSSEDKKQEREEIANDAATRLNAIKKDVQLLIVKMEYIEKRILYIEKALAEVRSHTSLYPHLDCVIVLGNLKNNFDSISKKILRVYELTKMNSKLDMNASRLQENHPTRVLRESVTREKRVTNVIDNFSTVMSNSDSMKLSIGKGTTKKAIKNYKKAKSEFDLHAKIAVNLIKNNFDRLQIISSEIEAYYKKYVADFEMPYSTTSMTIPTTTTPTIMTTSTTLNTTPNYASTMTTTITPSTTTTTTNITSSSTTATTTTTPNKNKIDKKTISLKIPDKTHSSLSSSHKAKSARTHGANVTTPKEKKPSPRVKSARTDERRESPRTLFSSSTPRNKEKEKGKDKGKEKDTSYQNTMDKP